MDNFKKKILGVFLVVSVIICIITFNIKASAKPSIEKYEEYISTNQKSNSNIDIELNEKDMNTPIPTANVEPKNGLIKVDGVWGYYENNVLQTGFSGIKTNHNGTYIVEKGLVNFDITGLKKIDGVWYYIKKGQLILDAYGLVKNKNGIWLVEDGEIDFGYKGTYVASGSVKTPKKGQKRYYINKNKVNQKRSTIVTQALAYLNTPYVYGGTSLKNGIDCSAFTRAIYKKAGISLERTARSQATQGKKVTLSKAKPGDLIFYSGSRYGSITHVAIYLGNNKIVHAGYSKRKVVVANVDLGMTIKCIKSYTD